MTSLWRRLRDWIRSTAGSGRENVQAIETEATGYDVFISYRSSNIESIRILAEQLQANGVRVWLPEYQIAAEERPDFQNHINAAIANSRLFLYFWNEEFAASSHCMAELDQARSQQHLWPAQVIRCENTGPRDWTTSQSEGQLVWHGSFDFSRDPVLRSLLDLIGTKLGREDLSFDPKQPKMQLANELMPTLETRTKVIEFMVMGWQSLPLDQLGMHPGILKAWRLMSDTLDVRCCVSVRSIGPEERFFYGSDRGRTEAFITAMTESNKSNGDVIFGIHHIEI